MLVAVAAFYFPGGAGGDPPARGWVHRADLHAAGRAARRALARAAGRKPAGDRPGGLPLAILVLFALWANLHGGFIAGLLLLGLATVGLAIDHWRGIPGAVPLSRVAVLGPRRRARRGHRHRRDPARRGDLGRTCSASRTRRSRWRARSGSRPSARRSRRLPRPWRPASPPGCGCARRGRAAPPPCW